MQRGVWQRGGEEGRSLDQGRGDEAASFQEESASDWRGPNVNSRTGDEVDVPFREATPEGLEGVQAAKWKSCVFIADRAGVIFCVLTSILVGILTVGAVTLPITVETNFDSFLVTDVVSSIQLNAFYEAVSAKSKVGRRLSDAQDGADVYMSKDLLITYELASGARNLDGGIFHSKAISAIKRFENKLRSLPGWLKICDRAATGSSSLCTMGMSFVNYRVPSLAYEEKNVVPNKITLDGLGFDSISTRTALELVEKQGVSEIFLPTAYSLPDADLAPFLTSLRSAFRFRLPCCSTADPVSRRAGFAEAFNKEWEDFFFDSMLEVLKSGPDEPDNQVIQVWYEGSDLQTIEVKQALRTDALVGIFSVLVVFAYMLFHTRKILLSFFGPLLAMSAVPLSFVLCAVIFGLSSVSFATCLALFLIVGFGADVMLIYTDFWDESSEFVADPAERLAWTYKRGIKSSATTTGTTALAFFANLASVIRALRQFGFFMGLCVLSAWCLITAIYVPLLIIEHRIKLRGGYFFCCCPRGLGEQAMTPMMSKVTRDASGKAKLKNLWVRSVWRSRWCLVIGALVAFLGMLGIAIPNMVTGEDLPSLFPPDHNENKGKLVRDLYTAASQAFPKSFVHPDLDVKVCEHANLDTSCAMFWCEAKILADPRPGSDNCTCFRKMNPPGTCGATSRALVEEYIIGRPNLTHNQIYEDIGGFAHTSWNLENQDDQLSPADFTVDMNMELPISLLQNWVTGDTSLAASSYVKFLVPVGDGTNCGWMDRCYCGSWWCELGDPWTQVSQRLVLQDHRRLRDEASSGLLEADDDEVSGRRLDNVYVPLTVPADALRVRVVVGLQVPDSVPFLVGSEASQTMDFLPYFDLAQPWAQRNTLSLCTGWTQNMQVAHDWCWIRDFRKFAREKTGRFPVRSSEFHDVAMNFIQEKDVSTGGEKYVWLQDNKVKAFYISVIVDVQTTAETSELLHQKELWTDYVDEWNSVAVKSARGAIHVSETWVQVESASELIKSTVETLAILFTLSFTAVFIFTQSCTLSLMVVLATAFVVCGTFFFVVVIQGWEVGLIEIVAFVYFVGYALDYSVHVVYKYSTKESLRWQGNTDVGSERSNVRLQRTSFSLKSIGGAIVGSALTTSGTSLLLLFCKLTLLHKLGAMCLAVSIFSALVAIGPLPALLMICGPVNPGCCLFQKLARRRLQAAKAEAAKE